MYLRVFKESYGTTEVVYILCQCSAMGGETAQAMKTRSTNYFLSRVKGSVLNRVQAPGAPFALRETTSYLCGIELRLWWLHPEGMGAWIS